MFKTTLAAVGLSIALALPTHADDEALRDAALSYINSDAQQKAMDQMLSADQIMGMMRAQVPGATEEQLSAVSKIVEQELGTIREKMEAAMVDAAVDTFSLEEIKALDEFYRSDIGSSVMIKMPVFMQSSMGALGPDMVAMQGRIQSRVLKEVMNK